MAELRTLSERVVLAALREGVRRALADHAQANNPVAVWKNGQVVWMPAEDVLRAMDSAASEQVAARPMQALSDSGFVASGEGPEDLATRYKEYAHESWADKHDADRG